jgi:Ras-related protein Rab-5C
MQLDHGQTIRDAKVVMLGSSTVGKSSIVTRLIRNTFPVEVMPTIGASFLSKTMAVGETQVKLQIWDTGGSERYRSMAPMYFRDADAAIIVYDVTSTQTFQEMEIWLKELYQKGPQSIIIALAGNKSDLTARRAVDESSLQRFAEKYQIDTWMETSALTGDNINELFESIAKGVITRDVGRKRSDTAIRSSLNGRKRCDC